MTRLDFHKNRKIVANGRIYIQGDVFYPGAESIAPARGVIPPQAVLGTGYIHYDQVPVVGMPQVMSNQNAAPIGLGVQLGQFIHLTPLQANLDAQANQNPNAITPVS